MRKRIESLKYALSGLKTIFLEEKNFRVHTICAIVVVILGAFFHLNQEEWVTIIICIVSVLVAEIFNTCIENTLDLITTEYHPMIKKIKDMCAAAVLLVALLAVVVGLIVFLPKICSLLNYICI